MYLNQEQFLNIINHTPLVSIDLLIMNKNQQVLLGLRNNKPAKGYWFVPGGRIMKNETIDKAVKRILYAETGLNGNNIEKNLKGVYDHIYSDNFSGTEGINTHYVVIAYEINFNKKISVTKDTQHEQYLWWNIDDLLNDNLVHQNTKNYFI